MQPITTGARDGEGKPVTLWGARVIDGRGNVHDRAAVVVSGGRISQLEPLTGDRPPAGVIDLRGRTLLPGLIDAHVHLSSDVDRSPGFGPRETLKGEPPRLLCARPSGPRLHRGGRDDRPRRRQLR
jgi:imidazolonepropionase-like amidohydrolase